MTENGSYVPRAELKATVEPMRDDIAEVKADVKTLLKRDAGAQAVSGLLRHATMVIGTVCAGIVGALSSRFIH